MLSGIMQKVSADYLHALQINPRLLAKLPIQKLRRITSLTYELRKLKKNYWWFHHNAIVIELTDVPAHHKVSVLICATVKNYKVRVDLWPYSSSGSFFVHEFESDNGHALLFELVHAAILPASFLPTITLLHAKINEL